MGEASITSLPPVAIEGHKSSGLGTTDHPMRIVTRRAAGLEKDGWTDDLREHVQSYFDELSVDWNTRTTPERLAVVADVLERGLTPLDPERALCVEIGSGTGAYSPLLADRFTRVIAVDLSLGMLKLAPAPPGHRVQADASRLPLRDGAANAVVMINAFLFPSEVERVLSPHGVLVWINISGDETPIYLSMEDLVSRLSGEWRGFTSRSGASMWSVLQKM